MEQKLTKEQREILEAIHTALRLFEVSEDVWHPVRSCIYGAELLVQEALNLDFGKTLGELSKQHDQTT